MVADLKSTTKRRIKDFAIRAGLEFVARTDLGRWLPEAAGRGVIFTLHHVRPARNYDFEPNEHLAITPDFLDIAIKEALACGLRPVALHELPALDDTVALQCSFPGAACWRSRKSRSASC